MFITHSHGDHMGLTGWVDPGVAIYAAPETVKVRQSLTAVGDAARRDPLFEMIFAARVILEGGTPNIWPMDEDKVGTFGPFLVTRLSVDQDVPGASGYLIESGNQRVAFTGDIRLHGRHPEWVKTFAKKVHGVDVLVIERTTLAAPSRASDHSATETQVDSTFADMMDGPDKRLGLYYAAAAQYQTYRVVHSDCQRTWPRNFMVKRICNVSQCLRNRRARH